MFDDAIDEQLNPDLAAQAMRCREAQALTNRLYSLTEFLSTRHPLPSNSEGTQADPVAFDLHRQATMDALRAVSAIARESAAWAARPRED